jgi:hypothetical protein
MGNREQSHKPQLSKTTKTNERSISIKIQAVIDQISAQNAHVRCADSATQPPPEQQFEVEFLYDDFGA